MSEALRTEGGDFMDSTLATIRKRQREIDNLPPETRALVHEFGWGIVSAFLDVGIKKPSIIRHLVETTMRGAYETRERRRSWLAIAPAVEDMAQVLHDIGSSENPGALVRGIRRRGGALLRMKASRVMVNASVAALDDPKHRGRRFDVFEKHKIRLDAALAAGIEEEMGGIE
jgi:hypothetical protein